MKINSIAHTSVIVNDLGPSLKFYCDVLGLYVDATRPDLGYPGAWLVVNAQQQIHLLQLPNSDPRDGRPAHGGRDRHTALTIDDIAALRQRLDQRGIAYTTSMSGRAAVFCRDPDGNAWEFIATV